MKKKLLLCAILCTSLLSCSRVNDVEESSNMNASYATIQACSDWIYDSGFNLAGYKVRFCNGNVEVERFNSYVSGRDSYLDDVKLVDMGPMKNLSNISTIPSNGWESSVSAIVGHGYILKVTSHYKQNDPHTSYTRFYIIEYLNYGDVSGYKISYQESWNPLYN